MNKKDFQILGVIMEENTDGKYQAMLAAIHRARPYAKRHRKLINEAPDANAKKIKRIEAKLEKILDPHYFLVKFNGDGKTPVILWARSVIQQYNREDTPVIYCIKEALYI